LVVVVAIQRDSVEVTVMVEVDSSYTVMAAAVDLLLSSADACFETDSFFSSLVWGPTCSSSSSIVRLPSNMDEVTDPDSEKEKIECTTLPLLSDRAWDAVRDRRFRHFWLPFLIFFKTLDITRDLGVPFAVGDEESSVIMAALQTLLLVVEETLSTATETGLSMMIYWDALGRK
jgi:hypothetical protein